MPPQWIIQALWPESFIFMASTWPLLALKAAFASSSLSFILTQNILSQFHGEHNMICSSLKHLKIYFGLKFDHKHSPRLASSRGSEERVVRTELLIKYIQSQHTYYLRRPVYCLENFSN